MTQHQPTLFLHYTNLDSSLAGKQKTDATILSLVLYQDAVDVDLGGPVDVGNVPVAALVVIRLVDNHL